MPSARVGVQRGGSVPCSAARGFTLVELSVVLIIIGVMMSILVPSLAAVRASARKVQSLTVLNAVSTAASQFVTDRRTAPGFFTPAEMGSLDNGDPSVSPTAGSADTGGRSFAQMQNIMIDLAGGLINDQSAGAAGNGILRVGPTTARLANIDPAQIGSVPKGSGDATRSYYVPDRQFYIAQDSVDRQAGTVDDHRQLPTLVDAFGYPILAWSIDERADAISRSSNTNLSFAAANADATSPPRVFYWAQNRAFLAATNLGGRNKNQTWAPGDARDCSVIGSGAASDALRYSLAGLLGNPALPLRDGLETQYGPAPAAPRGSIVFQSAGPNGYYAGSRERGGIKARRTRTGNGPDSTPANSIDYLTGGNDAIDDFDDQLTAVGN